MALPANVQFGEIVWRAIRAVTDGVDPDRDPDGIPVDGLTVKFTASVKAVNNLTDEGNETIFFDPVAAVTDEDGVLVDEFGVPGVRLVATNSEGLDNTTWTYKVEISGPTIAKYEFSFSLLAGSSVDLANVVRVPSSPGATLAQWLSASSTAIAARDAAIAAKEDIEALDLVLTVNGEGPDEDGNVVVEGGGGGGLDDSGVAALIGDAESETRQALDGDFATVASLADVATSGSFADLIDAPSIPDSADDVGAVPTTRTVAGHALSSNVTLVKGDVGLGNVDNTADSAKPVSTAQQTALDGKADLVGGTVPSAQLPAFVDDVLEYANFGALPGTGATGKIYVTLDDNKTYRWGGSSYVEISASLALGETSATAYRGDRGKTAYDHSQVTTGNPHGTTKGDLGLGNVDNTSDANKPVSTAQQAALDLKAPLASPTFTGNPTAPTPSAGDSDTSIATTAFVMAALLEGANNLPIKEPVRVVATANVTIASALENGDSLDGVTLATGDRVLLSAQSTGSQNGIYVVPASGTASRAADADSDADMRGMIVPVLAGTHAGSTWMMTNASAVTVGTTALTFVRLTAQTATETLAGILEVATSGEVTTGTADDKIITPLKLAAALANRIIGLNGATGLWIGTQSEYDAIGSPSATVLYAIKA